MKFTIEDQLIRCIAEGHNGDRTAADTLSQPSSQCGSQASYI